MNYITPAELKTYYDERRLYDLASDTGVPLTAAAYNTSTVVATAIRAASAHIDSAVQVGRRYERTQLEDIVTASNAGGATDAEKSRAEPIKTLCAHIAFGIIVARRGYAAAKLAEMAPMYSMALEQLNQLASGVRILDLDGPKQAGVPLSIQLGSSLYSWTKTSPMFGVFPSGPNALLSGP